MKDYIFAVTDLEGFREALLASDSDLVTTAEDSGVATIQSATTMVHYNGNQSVAIARLQLQALVDMQGLAGIEMVGQASDMFIKKIDDVTWSNKDLYYSIYDITPRTFADEDGAEHTYTPPALHCVFA